MLFWTPHFSVLGSTFFVSDCTFWLDSTLKIDPADHVPTSTRCAYAIYAVASPCRSIHTRRWRYYPSNILLIIACRLRRCRSPTSALIAAAIHHQTRTLVAAPRVWFSCLRLHQSRMHRLHICVTLATCSFDMTENVPCLFSVFFVSVL